MGPHLYWEHYGTGLYTLQFLNGEQETPSLNLFAFDNTIKKTHLGSKSAEVAGTEPPTCSEL